ncbi:MAG: hypothetical protein GY939_18550 [Actinomycetia bacterium]|nr:hypothetical protein [Actinomycetes bacterium]
MASQEAIATRAAAELATIDAAGSSVVLHRAIELSDSGVLVTNESFPMTSVEQVAAELQIPLTALAEALAEYRAGALSVDADGAKRTLLDRLVGPAQVKVGHRTGMPEEVTTARLREWLKRRHRLRIRVNPQGVVIGVRRRGAVPLAVRRVRSATGRAGLSGVREVRGAVVAVEEGHTAFCVVADVSDVRARSVIVGSAMALGGVAVVSTAAVVTAPVTLVGVPVVVGAGWATSRLSHRHRLKRVTEEVEMTADEIAAGAEPPNLVSEIGSRLGSPRLRS